MADLGEELQKVEDLKKKSFTILGLKMTPMTIAALFTLLSTVIGTLYGGFVMYKKVMSVANLDIGEYQAKMELMDAKVEEALKYAKDIKDGLRSDIMRLERNVERNTEKTDRQEEKVRSMLDSADARFESRREQLRQSQKADMKELEDRLNAKVQRALDNPLAK